MLLNKLKFWWKRHVIAGDFPHNTYLICHRPRLLYAPIPKVACTNIKSWLLRVAGIPEQQWEQTALDGIHPYAHRVLGLTTKWQVYDPRYFRFSFVRNPFSRLVSGFLDKFVQIHKHSVPIEPSFPLYPVLQWLKSTQGINDPMDITFENFATYIECHEKKDFDHHWMPQVCFLGSSRWDMIGKLECIKDDFAILRQKTNINIDIGFEKPSLGYSSTDSPYAGDLTVRHLLNLNSYPTWQSFYSEATSAKIFKCYQHDFDRFGYASSLV